MATVKKSKKRIIIPICIVLVIAIVIGVAFGVSAATGGEEVSLNTISTGDIYEKVSLTGTVASGTVKEYKADVVATVKEVFVNTGDSVKKGDVLATFDTTNLDSQVSSLRSSYNESLNSYNSALKAQKQAKKKADQISAQIEDTKKEISRIENSNPTVKNTTKRTTARTTAKQTTKKQSAITTTTTTTAAAQESTDDESSTSTTKPEIDSLTDALIELNKNLSELSSDIDTLTEATKVISDAITEAVANGVTDSDVIAQKVSEAVSQALRDGVIDAAGLLVDNDAFVNAVSSAVESIDFGAVTDSLVNSKNVTLTAAQIQLASQEAQLVIYKAQADDSILSAQKKAVDATASALDVLERQQDEMQDGWVAAFDGTITEMDLTPGMPTSALSTGIKLENLNTMAVTVSLSEYDLHKVKVGMPAKVTTAYGTYDAEVTSIAPTATGGSSSSLLDSVGSMAGISGLSSLTDSGAGVECTVTIPKTDDNIIAGFDADVEIETGEYLGVVVVPIESIKLEKTGSFVYLYNEDDKTVTKTPIETGAVSDSVYEVKSGLKVGDRIISAPASDYEEDTFKVKVVEGKEISE